MTVTTFALVVSMAIASVHGHDKGMFNATLSNITNTPNVDIIWDGRVSVNTTLSDFDTASSKFNPHSVHGNSGNHSLKSSVLSRCVYVCMPYP